VRNPSGYPIEDDPNFIPLFMPYREFESLQAVDRFLSLKINSREELQEIVELASELCAAPIALITLMGDKTQHIKFKVGTYVTQQATKETFCQFLVGEEELLMIPDTLQDQRCVDLPWVKDSTNIRFYAGVPLNTHDGLHLGSICVMGRKAKELTDVQKRLLKTLAKRVLEVIEFSLSLRILKNQVLEAESSDIKLRSFFESAGTCHLLIGKEMEIIAFNKNMADFLADALQVEIYAGLSVNEIIGGKHLQSFLVEYERALSGDSVFFERKVEYQNTTLYWSVVMEPRYNAEGDIIGVSYNATDITERKLQQQQIREQNRNLVQIAHIQSHELRKPVASILGLMEIFKSNDYLTTQEEIMMLGRAAQELDDKIRSIVSLTQA